MIANSWASGDIGGSSLVLLSATSFASCPRGFLKLTYSPFKVKTGGNEVSLAKSQMALKNKAKFPP
ncbi:MAG: hypothetical protein DRI99_00115 [Candidatus Aminicenantes bacterium]|nr:MAG: hypothetical protein DRJ11_10345 [Candidatus Aminicenantes bacterium]RLE06285.1 MAG: hypothetical protein DRI99_00115 [Candidatus Aminicenantes bacterium]